MTRGQKKRQARKAAILEFISSTLGIALALAFIWIWIAIMASM